MCSGECFEMMFWTNGVACDLYFSNISIPDRALKDKSNIHQLMCTIWLRFNVGCSMFLVRGNVSRTISLGINLCPQLSCILWIFYFQMTPFWNWTPLRLPLELKKLYLTSSLPYLNCFDKSGSPWTGWFCLQLIRFFKIQPCIFHEKKRYNHVCYFSYRREKITVLVSWQKIFCVHMYGWGWECKTLMPCSDGNSKYLGLDFVVISGET